MKYQDIIVAGASAGGIKAFRNLLGQLPADLQASVFFVQHRSAEPVDVLADIFDKAGALPVVQPNDGDTFEQGRVYIAPADHHLLLEPERMRVVMGPRENRNRPAIDPLFRSAAISFGSRVIGIVLSGLLDDGAAGLLAIRRCNGTTIVQDPEDAQCREMPDSALAVVNPDHCVLVAAMGALLDQLTRTPAKTSVPVPRDLELEIQIVKEIASDVAAEQELGRLVPFSCPECGGPLWEKEDEAMTRYRCHVGHAFTQRTLVEEQKDSIEKTLWIALRSLEEKSRLLSNLERHELKQGRKRMADRFQKDAEESKRQVLQLRNILAGRG